MKIPKGFYGEIDDLFLKFTWKCKEAILVKQLFQRKNIGMCSLQQHIYKKKKTGLIRPNFQNYSKVYNETSDWGTPGQLTTINY